MPTEALNLLHERFSPFPTEMTGVSPYSRALMLAALTRDDSGPALVLTASRAEADRLADDLRMLEGRQALLFPEAEMSMFDEGESDPERLRVLHGLATGLPLVVVAPLLALLQPVPGPNRLRKRILRTSQELDIEKLKKILEAWEYAPADLVTQTGDLALRKGVMDLFPSNGEPLRIKVCDGKIVSLARFDTSTQRTVEELDEVVILPMVEPDGEEALLDYFSDEARIVLVEPEEIGERLGRMASAVKNGWRFSVYREVEGLKKLEGGWKELLPLFESRPLYTMESQGAPVLADQEPFESLASFCDWAGDCQEKIFLVTSHPKRLQRLLKRRGLELASVSRGGLSGGVKADGLFQLVTDRELFHSTRRKRYELKKPPTQALEFSEGDLVVHAQRGIGRFLGLTSVALEGSRSDLLKLDYANDQTLLIPPTEIGHLSRYRGDSVEEPSLSRLDTERWQKLLTTSLASIAETARALKREAAARKGEEAPAMAPDGEEAEDFAAAFPFEETPSQEEAIDEIRADLEKSTAMDRLLCGDVAYGKTEVALRAVFKVVSSGYQAAVLVPTTVLADQHLRRFQERLKPFGVRAEGLWGDVDGSEEILVGLKDGSIQVVVGTHSLLSEEVSFARLGLLVVDEEQSFGVAHKEQLRELARGTHVLSMTATPIPRTTQLALSGVRDISLLDAPPLARRPVRTYRMKPDDDSLAAALMRELERGGQAFVLRNRVDDLEALVERVERLVPGARVAEAHGQMAAGEVEERLKSFLRGEFDVLVCTTIIESGVDFPNANTIVVLDAHLFGLSQLYQLRGRVGRAESQAYCYLVTPPEEELKDTARRRLDTLLRLNGLGGGYQVALRDLEIRGAGDLLGEEQSGHIGRLGYALYSRLLRRCLSGEEGESEGPLFVYKLPLNAYIPEDFIGPTSLRVELYSRLAEARERAEIEALAQEVEDRFGSPPPALTNLLSLTRLRLMAERRGIATISVEEQFGERELVCADAEGEAVERFSDVPKGDVLSFLTEKLDAVSVG